MKLTGYARLVNQQCSVQYNEAIQVRLDFRGFHTKESPPDFYIEDFDTNVIIINRDIANLVMGHRFDRVKITIEDEE